MQLSMFDNIENSNKNVTDNSDIAELINRRRNQILVHSCIYYRLNDSIIEDDTFDYWSKELVELQNEYPEISGKCRWANVFKDFTGESGFDLPLGNPWVYSKAVQLLEYRKRGVI